MTEQQRPSPQEESDSDSENEADVRDKMAEEGLLLLFNSDKDFSGLSEQDDDNAW